MSAKSEKENLENSGPRLQRRSLPASKTQNPPSHLALARRPLRDTKNLQESFTASITDNGKCCLKLSEKVSLMPAVAPRLFGVTMNSQTRKSISLSSNNLTAENQGSVIVLKPSGEEQTKAVEREGKDTSDCSASINEAFECCEEPLLGVSDECTELLKPHMAPNQAWGNPEGSFFPSLRGQLETEGHLKSGTGVLLDNKGSQQGGESVIVNQGSTAFSLRYPHLGNKAPQCLMPIPEISPQRECKAEEEQGEEVRGQKTFSFFQDFFSQDCARVIDNIRRTSFRGFVGGGSSARVCMETLDITTIEEEPSPDWNSLNYTVERSCLLADVDVSKPGVALLPLHSEEEMSKMTMSEAEDEDGIQESVKESNVISSSSAKKVSLLMERTRSINSTDNDSNASLGGTYSLSDVQESGEGQGLLGPSAQLNVYETFVLHDDSPQAKANLTTDLTEQSPPESGVGADVNPLEASINGTYELQPVLEKEPVAICPGDDDDQMGKTHPGSSRNEGLDESICKSSVEGGQSEGVSVMTLDDTLEMKANFLVTSTPMPMSKVFNLTKEAAATPSDVCKQLSAVISTCCKEDTVNVSRVDGNAPATRDGTAQTFNVKVPATCLPRPAALAPRQGYGSRPSSGLALRKSLLPSSALLSNTRSLLPPPRPITSQQLTQSSVRKSFTAPQVSGPAATPSTSHLSIAKKTEGASRYMAANSCLQTTAVSTSIKMRQSFTETKLPSSGFQRRLLGGVPPPAANRNTGPDGSKGKGLQPPSVTQKRPRINTGDCLPVPRRKRVDAPSSSTEGPRGPAKPAAGIGGLRRPTTKLKSLEAKTNNSDPDPVPSSVPVLPCESLPVPEDDKCGCTNCEKYQQEIGRLRAEIKRLQAVHKCGASTSDR